MSRFLERAKQVADSNRSTMSSPHLIAPPQLVEPLSEHSSLQGGPLCAVSDEVTRSTTVLPSSSQL